MSEQVIPAPAPSTVPPLVVGIGASAGGLDACTRFLAALPAGSGLALVLVQHLDPHHESMLVDLLGRHASLPVVQAADLMRLEPDHLYVIPPASYLAVEGGLLRVSAPAARHGARMPFDFLLASLALAYGPRAAAVILSGTGSDGAAGAVAIRAAGGIVLAQDPGEAWHGGMPQSAIDRGAVDQVLPAAKIAPALIAHGAQDPPDPPPPPGMDDPLDAIVTLLRQRTPHDFRLYKPGTLRRRIARRMLLLGLSPDAHADYRARVETDTAERDLLAADLLINVTEFFRDAEVFDVLRRVTMPDLVRTHDADRPLRLWIAGCSTGEEAYSLAMVALEAIGAERPELRLQIFASDIDPDAVETARTGFYSDAAIAALTPERRERFFLREDKGYRVAASLRAAIVFTVQNVLLDPPFARIDLVSCRNLMIYLSPEAQSRAIAIFHFSLRPGGLLLLGTSETAGDIEGRFEVVAKRERLYRRIGKNRPSEIGFLAWAAEPSAGPLRLAAAPAPPREAALAELCRRSLLDRFAPAAILVNATHESLYAMGPVTRYLGVPTGPPTHDVLAMAGPALRARLRTALDDAARTGARVRVDGRRGGQAPFALDVEPLVHDGERVFLVAFVDLQAAPSAEARPDGDPERTRLLERELEATRAELEGAVRSLEQAVEEQKAITEETLSVSEEYQSTNEELMTSKEELQSLNEELTALNSQLQETLERQRTTANDLQNVLYSTDMATLFLDADLKIRFFTPATRSLFAMIPADVGRPLSDLSPLASDDALPGDAARVLVTLATVEREVETRDGSAYLRRVLPYRTHDGQVAGVVITFVDITAQRRTAAALDAARLEAERASAAKSRFLAAASHDLRQPLQSLALLSGLLMRSVTGEPPQRLLGRLDEMLDTMTGMLDTLLDINRIEAGTVEPAPVALAVDTLFGPLRDGFVLPAEAQGTRLTVMPSRATIQSDPALLTQMLRNLLSNALKFTTGGRVLLGCRRQGSNLRIEVWDTGVGIAEEHLDTIFEAYRQVAAPARRDTRSLGLGLGLSIVHRIGLLLGHAVGVRSWPGRGSVFWVTVPLAPATAAVVPGPAQTTARGPRNRTGRLLVIEDDAVLRELFTRMLTDEGHDVVAVRDGAAAVDRVDRGGFRPNVIIADFNLPGGMTGLDASVALCRRSGHPVGVIIVSGDITTRTLREIGRRGFLLLRKPVKPLILTEAIGRYLGAAEGPPDLVATVHVVDDDQRTLDILAAVIVDGGHAVVCHTSAEAYLAAPRTEGPVCLVLDAYLPGMSGLDLQRRLAAGGQGPPVIMITGKSDVGIAVEAMRAGAVDFIEKPVGRDALLASIARAVDTAEDSERRTEERETARRLVASLTPRQRQVLDLVLAGHPSKNIAADLGLSQRTVENHRAAIMRRMGARSIPALAHLAQAALPRP